MSLSVLATEIAEQPEALRRLLLKGYPFAEQIADRLRGAVENHVVIAARGSSDNAARYAQYVFGAFNRLTVTLATPSLYTRYTAPPRMTGALVVGISQSGQSPDLVAVVEEGRRQGCPTLAITNVSGSPLSAVADHTLALGVGLERSVAATKSYTAQLFALAMLSTAMAGDAARRRDLDLVPDLVQRTVAVEPEAIAMAARVLKDAGHGVVIGRGFNFATAFEIALKAKELACVAVEPYSAADFQHGPIALVESGFAAIVVNPDGAVSQEVDEILRIMVDRGARPVVISNRPMSLALASAPLRLPDPMPEWISPIAAVVPGQLLACELSRVRGFDPDRPRGLQKVTRTT
jgi:glucosamine--fructose-6-phosphate aminotransferase (isomerizing)